MTFEYDVWLNIWQNLRPKYIRWFLFQLLYLQKILLNQEGSVCNRPFYASNLASSTAKWGKWPWSGPPWFKICTRNLAGQWRVFFKMSCMLSNFNLKLPIFWHEARGVWVKNRNLSPTASHQSMISTAFGTEHSKLSNFQSFVGRFWKLARLLEESCCVTCVPKTKMSRSEVNETITFSFTQWLSSEIRIIITGHFIRTKHTFRSFCFQSSLCQAWTVEQT